MYLNVSGALNDLENIKKVIADMMSNINLMKSKTNSIQNWDDPVMDQVKLVLDNFEKRIAMLSNDFVDINNQAKQVIQEYGEYLRNKGDINV